MSDRSPQQALADVLGALVRGYDTTDLLSALVRDCTALLPADAVAVLVQNRGRGLELLTATSHRAADLEIYQAQQQDGPCVDAARTGEVVIAIGHRDITTRWHDVGRAIVDAGFLAVHAFPMTWRGQPFGGLNVFSGSPEQLPDASMVLAQNFADVATLALTQPDVVSGDDLAARVEAALEGRVEVERAKGVLAQTLGVDMEQAYDQLVRRALDTSSTLSHTARQIVDEAQQR